MSKSSHHHKKKKDSSSKYYEDFEYKGEKEKKESKHKHHDHGKEKDAEREKEKKKKKKSELHEEVTKQVLSNLESKKHKHSKKKSAKDADENKFSEFLSTLDPKKSKKNSNIKSSDGCCDESSSSEPVCESSSASASSSGCTEDDYSSDCDSECTVCYGPPGPRGYRGPAGNPADISPYSQVRNLQSGNFIIPAGITFPYQFTLGPYTPINTSTLPLAYNLSGASETLPQTASMRQLVVTVSNYVGTTPLSAAANFNITVTVQVAPSTFGVSGAPSYTTATTSTVLRSVPLTASTYSTITNTFGPFDTVVLPQGDLVAILVSITPIGTFIAGDQALLNWEVNVSQWLTYEGSN